MLIFEYLASSNEAITFTYSKVSIKIDMFTSTIRKISLFAFILFAFAACQEVCPDIDPPSVNNNPPVDTTGEVLRHVLIEEFTGVQCVNCPQGAQLIENLINTHGERLISVSIHAGFFAEPVPESQYDLSTDTGEQLDALIGPVEAYPSAAINRNMFGTGGRIHFSPTWAGFVEEELAVAPQVDVQIGNSFNENNGELTANITVNFLETLTGDLSLSVMITENDIIDAQDDTSGLIEDYKHKHVFRTMLSNVAGNPIAAQASGMNVQESFTFNIPPEWNADKCKVVAFVHRAAPDLEVLQVSEKSLF